MTPMNKLLGSQSLLPASWEHFEDSDFEPSLVVIAGQRGAQKPGLLVTRQWSKGH